MERYQHLKLSYSPHGGLTPLVRHQTRWKDDPQQSYRMFLSPAPRRSVNAACAGRTDTRVHVHIHTSECHLRHALSLSPPVWDVAAAPVQSLPHEQGEEDASRSGLRVWETEGMQILININKNIFFKYYYCSPPHKSKWYMINEYINKYIWLTRLQSIVVPKKPYMINIYR